MGGCFNKNDWSHSLTWYMGLLKNLRCCHYLCSKPISAKQILSHPLISLTCEDNCIKKKRTNVLTYLNSENLHTTSHLILTLETSPAALPWPRLRDGLVVLRGGLTILALPLPLLLVCSFMSWNNTSIIFIIATKCIWRFLDVQSQDT